MKNKLAILMLCVAAVTCQARVDRMSPLTLTFSMTATVNNPALTTNGVTVTYPAPKSSKLTTATFIKLIAVDELSAGQWASNSFPASSKIVLMLDDDDFSGSYFVVEDKGGNVLLNISDLFTATIHQEEIVNSGKMNSTTEMVSGFTQRLGAELDFDDTSAGGGTVFELAGVVKISLSDTIKTGFYSEKESDTLSPATGMGFVGNNFASFSGSATFAGTTDFSLNEF